MKRMPAVLLALPVALAAACASGGPTPAAPAPDLIDGTGTVVHRGIEGGFYAIQADGGPAYDAHDLPAGFRIDGLRVAFTVRVLKDAACIHMAGPVVTVVRIDRLP